MNKKINEVITQISGVYTNPFLRYNGKIDLNELIDVLIKEKEKAEKIGYGNLKLLISSDSSLIDIDLYGDRDLTKEEILIQERIDVIGRVKEKTTEGLTREEILL